MSIAPLITFKAGKCELDTSSTPWTVKSVPTPGYIYLYADELIHFCWRPRTASVNDPEIDLLMIPTDGSFVPYTGKEPSDSSDNVKSPTDGRIFALKFSSSSQRHLFWLQSKSQSPSGDPSWFSLRDLKIGQIVDMLLQGDEVDVHEALREAQNAPGGDDDDETMEDAPGPGHSGQGSGGAGPDATGGDIREEGEEAREGGADGARAPQDASAIVQNFINSLQGGSGGAQQQGGEGNFFTTLADLLPASTTIPVIESASPALVNSLLSNLPPQILLLAQEADTTDAEPNAETVQAAIQALSRGQKLDILKRVLHSPQLQQSLQSLTVALRDGGLPSVSEALRIKVDNGGFVRRGGVPLGGGDAVEAFLKGVKTTVEEEEKEKEGGMDVDS